MRNGRIIKVKLLEQCLRRDVSKLRMLEIVPMAVVFCLIGMNSNIIYQSCRHKALQQFTDAPKKRSFLPQTECQGGK